MKSALDLSEVHLCACANLRRTVRVLTQFYDDLLRPSGLRTTQFSLLVIVAKRGPVTINQLAQALSMDRTTLTRNLMPLKRQQLIVVTTGGDQRTRAVTLTARGQRMLASAVPLWEQAQARIANGLGQERFRTVLNDLSSIESLAR